MTARVRHLRSGRSLTLGLGVALLSGACIGSDREPLSGDGVRQTLDAIGSDSIAQLASGDTVRISAATLEFYNARNMQATWIGMRGLLPQGEALHEAIGKGWEDGLPPERYRHDLALELISALENDDQGTLTDEESLRYRSDLDLLLTEGFNRMARDLLLGMVDPADAGIDHRTEQDSPPSAEVLNRIVGGEAPAGVVASLRPAHPQYERMREALTRFRELESRGAWGAIEADTTLHEGMRDEAIAQLRQRLMNGIDPGEAELARMGEGSSTLFDRELVQAVQHFQERHGLDPDGVIGVTTARELNHSAAEWIGELQLNLDRWRWLPRDLGERYVLVNIAGFELEVVENGEVIEAMDVVVGAEATATPIFADSIRHVVVNPYWNIPEGIMERTIEPAIADNPNYLRDNDMEIVDGLVRQRPGPQNALGRYKFLFPNEFDVYLHDTPDGHLFQETDRAFSSGCVRIERPRDFARMLLELQSDQDPDSLDALLATGEEQWIALDRPLPIYLLYFTAWIQEDGSARFHHDIYGHDEAILEESDEIGSPQGPS